MKHRANLHSAARAAGFTLIEMLVAISLLAVIALLSWRGLDATVRARDGIVANLAQTRLLGRCFSQLRYDALNLVTPDEVNGPPLRLLPGELVLVRHLGLGDGPTELQVVRYYLHGRQFLRSASPPLSNAAQLSEALQHMENFAGVVVNPDVGSMEVAVWLQPGGWTSQQASIAAAYTRFLTQHAVTTVSTLNLPMPRGIQLSITTGAAGTRFTRIVPLAE